MSGGNGMSGPGLIGLIRLIGLIGSNYIHFYGILLSEINFPSFLRNIVVRTCGTWCPLGGHQVPQIEVPGAPLG